MKAIKWTNNCSFENFCRYVYPKREKISWDRDSIDWNCTEWYTHKVKSHLFLSFSHSVWTFSMHCNCESYIFSVNAPTSTREMSSRDSFPIPFLGLCYLWCTVLTCLAWYPLQDLGNRSGRSGGHQTNVCPTNLHKNSCPILALSSCVRAIPTVASHHRTWYLAPMLDNFF